MGLCTVSDASIEALLRDPPRVWTILAPDDPERHDASRGGGGSWLSRWFAKRRPALAPEPLDPPVLETDLDKSWHGIHYLLTGTAWAGEEPLNFLVLGGEAIGDVDVGYGPARAIGSDGVHLIHAAFSAIDDSTLRSRFDRDEMVRLDIYPAIWEGEPGEDGAINYCANYFATLKAFIADASARGLGVLIHVS